MHLLYSLRLAVAKIRSHILRTSLSIVVSGVLFGFLITAIVVTRGTLNSIEQFSASTIDGRNLILASMVDTSADTIVQDSTLIKKAKGLFETNVQEKLAYAKQLGSDYNVLQEEPVTIQDNSGDNHSVVRLNLRNKIAQAVVSDYIRTHPSDALNELNKISINYKTKYIYAIEGLTVDSGTLTMDKNDNQLGSIINQGQLPYVMDESLLRPFMSKTTKVLSDTVIPVIIPYSLAENKVALTKLAQNATSDMRLNRFKEVQQKSTNLIFDLCYRNDISKQQIDQANSLTNTLTDNTKNNEIIYSIPKGNVCEAATIIGDNRTASKKMSDQKEQQFNQKFGTETLPKQQLVKFQIIGLTPDNQISNSKDNISQVLLSAISQPGLGFSAITSQNYELLNKSNSINKIFSLSSSTSDAINIKNYIIEFNNMTQASEFLNQHTCTTGGSCSGINSFAFSQFGSNSIQLSNVRKSMDKVFLWIIIVIAFIGMVVLGGTFSKVIVDSRRETAVFRALGAKKKDIIEIYVVYSIILSFLTTLFAIIVGYVVAYVIKFIYTKQLLVELQATYGLVNSYPKLHIVEPIVPELGYIVLIIFVTAIVSMLLSLVKNVGHNITADLKDE